MSYDVLCLEELLVSVLDLAIESLEFGQWNLLTVDDDVPQFGQEEELPFQDMEVLHFLQIAEECDDLIEIGVDQFILLDRCLIRSHFTIELRRRYEQRIVPVLKMLHQVV